MANIADLTGSISIEDRFSSKLDAIASKLSSLQDKMDQTASSTKKLESAASSVGSALNKIGAAVGLTVLADKMKDVITSSIEMAGKFEQTKVAMTNMLGSAQLASKFLDDLSDFAAKTPFQFDDLTNAAQKLMGMGFAAESIIPTMTSVGDAVAKVGGSSVEIDRVVRALGQMQAKGKVTAEEMMQIAETNIPAWRILAEEIGVSIPKAMEMASKGQIKAAEGVSALIKGMGKDAAGFMEAQSQTFLGKMSTLQDRMSEAMRKLGTALLPIAGQVMEMFSDRVMPVVQDFISLISDFASSGALDPLMDTFEALAEIIFEVGEIAVGLAQFFAGVLAPVFSTLFDAVKLVSGGFIDFKLAAENLNVAGDALRLMWTALKFVVVQVGQAVAGFLADLAAIAGMDELAATLDGNVKMLETLKLEYSDTANKIVDGSDKAGKATDDMGKQFEVVPKKMKAVGQAADELSDKDLKELDKWLKQVGKGVKEFGEFQSARLEKLQKPFDKLGKSVEDLSFDMGMLALQVDRFGGVSEMSRSQLEQLIADLEKLKDSGGTNAWGLETLNDALEELEKRGPTESIEALVDDLGNLTSEMDEIVGVVDSLNGAFAQLADILQDVFGPNVISKVIRFQSELAKTATSAMKLGASIASGDVVGAVQGGMDMLGRMAASTKAKTGKDRFLGGMSTGMGILPAGLSALFGGGPKSFEGGTFGDPSVGMTKVAVETQKAKEAQDRLNEAVNKYGFTVDELGPKWKQQELDNKAMELLTDYQLLTASGIEHGVVLEKMAPSMNEYVQTSIKAGTSIPSSLKGPIEKMLEMGLLTDEAGNKMTSLEGLTFADTLEESMAKVVKSIEDMVAALTGIPNVERSVTIRTITVGGEMGDEGVGKASGERRGGGGRTSGTNSGVDIPEFAHGGVVTGPTLAMVGEVPEAIIPLEKLDRMLAQQGSSVTFGPGSIVVYEAGDAQRTAQLVAQAIRDNLSGELVTVIRERTVGSR